MQFVFAGKAHPADEPGKALIQQVDPASPAQPDVRHRFVFLDDYDIASPGTVPRLRRVAEHPPAAARGVRHERDEGGAQRRAQLLDPRRLVGRVFDGTNGWAISSAESEDDLDRRDELEANSLFDLLERQIVPLFYQRTEGPVPRGLGRRVKHVVALARAEGDRRRMVRDYVTQLYEPGRHAARITADGTPPPRRSPPGRHGCTRRGGVHVVDVPTDTTAAELGAIRTVEARSCSATSDPTTSTCSSCTARSARATRSSTRCSSR